ncbi:PqiC family protein [Pseudomonas japonica]|uniref:PqiC family protein n=1 Tax=Pseudomonas japonica TaxID=256466 RepID=UPI0015E44337|nr:PqiC family protein [Pseudomonas japonica]MBA1243297.1 membrane integrity-associated transporter subunit PqiC [Pseudomonas japonica]MBA1290355.1 membrane integrity-associated transporter subunit PqiC [Pseudomonas japonica]
MRTSLVALFTSLVLLAGCRSAPVHYHTLTPLLSGPARTVQPTGNLLIERVTVPAQVDRTQIVVRQGVHGLAILETDWWGASLADELQGALVDQLNRHPAPASKTSLRVDVQRFDLVPGRYALLDVKWRLRTKRLTDSATTELNCQGIMQSPAGESVDDLVTAQQANVQAIAAMISEFTQASCKLPYGN